MQISASLKNPIWSMHVRILCKKFHPVFFISIHKKHLLRLRKSFTLEMTPMLGVLKKSGPYTKHGSLSEN